MANNIVLLIDDRYKELETFLNNIDFYKEFDSTFEITCCEIIKGVLNSKSPIEYNTVFVFLDTSWDKYRPEDDKTHLKPLVNDLVAYIREKKKTAFFVFPYSTIYRSTENVKVIFECFSEACKKDEKIENLFILNEDNWLKISDFKAEPQVAKIRWLEISELIKDIKSYKERQEKNV